MMTVIPGTRKEESQHYEYPTTCYPNKAAAWNQAEHALNSMLTLYSGVLDYEIHHEGLGANRGVIWAQLVRKNPERMVHCTSSW